MVSVAVAAQGRVVESQQLLVWNSLRVDVVFRVGVVESWTNIVFAVWRQRNVLYTSVTVVGLGEHYAVGQQVQLRRAARKVLCF